MNVVWNSDEPQAVSFKDVGVNPLTKVFHDAASSPLPWYLSCSGDVIGQSSVVMPTTGAVTSAVVYLCPPESYRQWVPPTTAATGPLIPAGSSGSNGYYPVTAGPHLIYPMISTISTYVGDRPQEMGLASLAAPYSYYQQPTVSSSTNLSVTSTCNQCLIPQTSLSEVGVPTSFQHHHNTIIQPLNPSDLVIDHSVDNPLVVSTK